MSSLEQAKNRLAEYRQKEKEVLCWIKSFYDDADSYEDDDAVKNAIGDDIILEWDDQRDIIYTSDTVECQEKLITALEMLEQGDKESIHNAKKAFEVLVNEARQIKKDREREIEKAQNVVDAMNEIIKVCDENRK